MFWKYFQLINVYSKWLVPESGANSVCAIIIFVRACIAGLCTVIRVWFPVLKKKIQVSNSSPYFPFCLFIFEFWTYTCAVGRTGIRNNVYYIILYTMKTNTEVLYTVRPYHDSLIDLIKNVFVSFIIPYYKIIYSLFYMITLIYRTRFINDDHWSALLLYVGIYTNLILVFWTNYILQNVFLRFGCSSTYLMMHR